MSLMLESKWHNGFWRTIQYHREPMAAWYLTRAARHARLCQVGTLTVSQHDAEEIFENAFLAIIYSALALEAGANQIAEDVIPDTDRDLFDRSRKPYERVGGLSAPTSKWVHLFKNAKIAVNHKDPIIAKADQVVLARNGFAHYKPLDSGAQLITDQKPPPVREISREGNTVQVQFDLVVPLVAMSNSQIVPSLVEKEINPIRAKAHYLAVRDLFYHWYKMKGFDTSDLDNIAPAL
jgi:hypothetical protein